MRARNIPFGSMFGWVPATFRLVSGNAGAMLLGSLAMLLALVLIMAPSMYFMFKSMPMPMPGSPPVMPMPTDLTGFWISYAVGALGGLLLFPPMVAGWFRLCADADRGVAVSGLQIFEPYRDTSAWLRLITFALLGLLSYLLVFALLYLAFHGAFADLIAMQAAQQAALATGAPPPPPSMALLGQIFALYAVMLPTMFVLQFVYMVGFAEVALRPTGAVAAFGEAAGGVLRNLIKLLLLMFCLGIVAMFAMFLVFLVIGLLAAALSFISKALMFVVLGLAYLVFLLALYPLIFSFHYFIWKDMLAGGEAVDAGAVAI